MRGAPGGDLRWAYGVLAAEAAVLMGSVAAVWIRAGAAPHRGAVEWIAVEWIAVVSIHVVAAANALCLWKGRSRAPILVAALALVCALEGAGLPVWLSAAFTLGVGLELLNATLATLRGLRLCSV